MSASMTEHVSRRLGMAHGISHVQRDIVDDRYRDLRRPRKVRFFVNGDRYFKGKKLYITPHRYYNFNDLLNDLTGKLPSTLNLPYGVRQIFTPVGGRRVSDMEDLQDGETYVCAGFEGFKYIKYGRAELEPWSVGKTVKLGQLQDSLSVAVKLGQLQDSLSLLQSSWVSCKTLSLLQSSWVSCKTLSLLQSSWVSCKTLSLSVAVKLGQLQDDAVSEASHGSYRYRGYAANAFHPGRYYRSNAAPGGEASGAAGASVAGAGAGAGQTMHKWPGTFGHPQRGPAGLHGGPTEAIPLKPRVITIVRNGPRPRINVKLLLNRRSVQSFEQLVADISEAFGPKWKSNRVQRLYTVRGKEVKGVSDFFREDDCFIALGNERLNDRDVADVISELYPDSAHAKVLVREWDKQRRRERRATREPQGDKRDSGFVEGSDNGSRDQDTDALSTHRSQRQTQRGGSKRAGSERDSLVGSESGSPQGYYTLSKLERERRTAAKEEREKIKRKQNKLAERERRALDAERKQRGLAPLNPLKPLGEIPRREEKSSPRREGEEHAGKTEEEREAERVRKDKEEREQAEKAARARMAAADKEKQEKESKEREKADKEAKGQNEKEEKAKTEKTLKSKTTERGSEKAENLVEAADGKDKPEKKRRKDNRDNASEKSTGRKAKPKPSVVRRSKSQRQISSDSFVMERYELGRTLGDGNFAIVKTSRQKSSNQEFAMKVIDKPKLKGKEHMVENEIDIMKDCSHPNIIKLYEEYETRDKIYLVMELVKGGDLFDAITQSVKFGELDSASMVKDMCNALYYLHSRSIVHRDLKPENLLVHRNKDGSITLKLADFGLAMAVKESIFTVCGTPTYVAPEILTEIGYGLEVDMWAVGVITYILLCGFPPFRSPDRNQTKLFELIKAGEYDFLSPYWDSVSHSAKDLVRRLLIVKKSKRHTAVDVLSHPWVVCGGGDTAQLPPGMADLATYCTEVKHDLAEQARRNYENYQTLKETKVKEEW
ncbi:hypothetical protein ACOMHN_027637 [Nucella lapillus]